MAARSEATAGRETEDGAEVGVEGGGRAAGDGAVQKGDGGEDPLPEVPPSSRKAARRIGATSSAVVNGLGGGNPARRRGAKGAQGGSPGVGARREPAPANAVGSHRLTVHDPLAIDLPDDSAAYPGYRDMSQATGAPRHNVAPRSLGQMGDRESFGETRVRPLGLNCKGRA